MKRIPTLYWRQALLAFSILLLNPCLTFAQTLSFPVVTIHAPDPLATESGDPATFEVDRQGPTNSTLNVYYQTLGTASNGVDYATISHFAYIPAGARSALIVIKPLQDTNDEGTETVILQLAPSPMMNPYLNPVNYMIGSPSNAIAYIFDDDDSNSPPAVNLFSPASGSSFYGPTNIQLFAKTFDATSSISNVEFYAGAQDLGSGSLLVLDPPGISGFVGPVYLLDWTNVPWGNYSVTAVATDNGGNSATSAPVLINVLPPPPAVKITSPTNGATFVAPVDIPINAEASSSNADVVKMNFFVNDRPIGVDLGTNKTSYALTWSNVPPGFYYLRAVATDSFGGKGSSAPVQISVTGTNKPPLLPLVTVYAWDPIAVVGTNCLSCYSNSPVATLNFRAVTNTATFVVRRSGDTNNSLVVNYSLSGTASNGVDYVALPGTVTIPAGKRAAFIVINPLDEGVPECPETVVLTLQPTPDALLPYLVGWPDRAAAIIVDCNFAPPPTAVLCDGAFHFFFPPATNAPYYRVECSSDMVHWLPVCTNAASELGIHFTDPQSKDFPSLFYRAIPQTNAVLDYP